MRSLVKSCYLIATILLLTACGEQTIRPDKPQYQGLLQAQNYYQSQNYTSAAQAYTLLHRTYQDDEFAIYAADSYLQMGELTQAQQMLGYVQHSNHPLLSLIRAELSINQGNYNVFLNDISGEFRPRFLKLHALVNHHNQNYLAAALSLIELSTLDRFADTANDIVNNLLLAPEQSLTQALFNGQVTELQQGWLEAAFIAKSPDNQATQEWKYRWGDHPGNAFFLLTNSFQNIAVLLPLTGKYKNISHSIQQGMIAALYQDVTNEQKLSFFDTGSSGENFLSAWYGAIESGAEFIIGPLEKKSINKLAQVSSSTVPILLLNQLEEGSDSLGFFQFPLAPEDEIINVASRLIAEDKKRVLLLAPESQSGRKLAIAFESEFNANGGELISYAFYPESTNDYSREIKETLGLNESVVRTRQLQTAIASKLVSDSRIRPDVDAIFIIAKPNQARLLKPQLKFFKAENIPVYSTSQILSRTVDTDLDKDLNGIKFCQSAFIIDPMTLQNVLDFDVSKIEGFKKYFALGYDAVSIYPRLGWMQTMQNQQFEGMSGLLNMDGNGKIHRELAWAQFQRGKPVLLAPLNPVSEEVLTNDNNIN